MIPESAMPHEIAAALAALAHVRFVASPTIAVAGETIKSWEGRELTIYEARMQDSACELLTAYFRSTRQEVWEPSDTDQDTDAATGERPV